MNIKNEYEALQKDKQNVVKKETKIVDQIFANNELKADVIDFLVDGCGYWFEDEKLEEIAKDELIKIYQAMDNDTFILSKVDEHGNCGFETTYTLNDAILDNFGEILLIIEKYDDKAKENKKDIAMDNDLLLNLFHYHAWQAKEINMLIIDNENNDEYDHNFVKNWFNEMQHTQEAINNIGEYGIDEFDEIAFFDGLSSEEIFQITELEIANIGALQKIVQKYAE